MPYYQNLTTLTNKKINQTILQQLAQLIKKLHQVKINDEQIST